MAVLNVFSTTVPPNEVPKIVAIDENVFLGNMKLLTNHSILKWYKIQRVMTLTQKISDKLSDKVPGVYYKHIYSDEYYHKYDIIISFEECYQYIREAQNYGMI